MQTAALIETPPGLPSRNLHFMKIDGKMQRLKSDTTPAENTRQ
jgi:hypothetical protein